MGVFFITLFPRENGNFTKRNELLHFKNYRTFAKVHKNFKCIATVIRMCFGRGIMMIEALRLREWNGKQNCAIIDSTLPTEIRRKNRSRKHKFFRMIHKANANWVHKCLIVRSYPSIAFGYHIMKTIDATLMYMIKKEPCLLRLNLKQCWMCSNVFIFILHSGVARGKKRTTIGRKFSRRWKVRYKFPCWCWCRSNVYVMGAFSEKLIGKSCFYFSLTIFPATEFYVSVRFMLNDLSFTSNHSYG